MTVMEVVWYVEGKERATLEEFERCVIEPHKIFNEIEVAGLRARLQVYHEIGHMLRQALDLPAPELK